MMIKYYAKCWSTVTITTCDVERETDSSVFIAGGKYKKRTESGGYFNTWDEAYAWIIKCKTKKATDAENTYKYYLKELEEAKRLCQK